MYLREKNQLNKNKINVNKSKIYNEIIVEQQNEKSTRSILYVEERKTTQLTIVRKMILKTSPEGIVRINHSFHTSLALRSPQC